MFCKKAILVNWGNIPNLEFEFGPVNLFSGGNGSGKTTAADALQTLMTAAYENLFTYNPGQDETTQRGRGGKQVRTLASYVLGCDDGSYSRPKATDGYVAGIFHPTQGEGGSPFTAMIGVRAEIETVGKQRQARQRDLQFFIIQNAELPISLLADDQEVVNLDHMAQKLRNEYGKKAVEIYDKKGLYLNRLYGALRGLDGSVSKREAQHAAKTFSSFMAYKPVKSINNFVAREILEPRDLSTDIKQVSELMKTIHEMESETQKIKTVVDNLHEINELSESYTAHWIDWRLCDYKQQVRLSWQTQQAYLAVKSRQAETNHLISENQQRIKNLNNKRTDLHEQLVILQAKRLGIDALKDKDQLESDIDKTKALLVEHARPLLEQDQQLMLNHQSAQDIKTQLTKTDLALSLPVLERADFRKALNRVIERGDNSGIDMQLLLTEDMVGLENLESKLEALRAFEQAHLGLVDRFQLAGDDRRSLRDQIMALSQQRLSLQNKLTEQTKVKQAEVRKLENQSISYPKYVEIALLAINQKCPQARPSVLCDFINITDEHWQMAIEGYIGGNRFAVIVEPEFEAEAIRIVRNLSSSAGKRGGRKNQTKIIQGYKAQRDASRLSTPPGSMLEVMSFEHKTAEFYIKGAYNNVLLVSDEQELRNTARGITNDGLASGGYSMFRCDIDEADLVFGQGARERALRAKTVQLQDLQGRRHSAEEAARDCDRLLHNVDQIKPININFLVTEMLALYRQIRQYESKLEALDLSDFEALETELAEKITVRDEIEQELQVQTTELGRCQSQLSNLKQQAERFSDEQDQLQTALQNAENVIDTISDIVPDFEASDAVAEAESNAIAHAKVSDADDDYENEQQHHRQRCNVLERQLDRCVLQHNEICRQADSIVYLVDTGSDGENVHNLEWLKRVVVVNRESHSINNRLKNNVLIGKHEQLADLKESFNTAFVSNLCHSIYQAINDGERTLKELNRELENHLFGTDREKYHFDYKWVPEFKEYQRFFKDVINLPSLGDGSSLFDAELSPQSAQVRDRLLSMLLDNDEQTARRELSRISDYRHYRDYEIYKTPFGKEPIALSQYGTGSGGQLETPSYIIRSAAVTAAFKFNEGNTHCRMVLVDEAFSKMDESRSREVIHYLTDKLGLQLIFIMPTSKSGPFMDLISHQTIFSKCPTEAKIGELNSQVLVDRRICNAEQIADLWAKHRRNIRVQGSLDFMQEFLETDATQSQ